MNQWPLWRDLFFALAALIVISAIAPHEVNAEANCEAAKGLALGQIDALGAIPSDVVFDYYPHRGDVRVPHLVEEQIQLHIREMICDRVDWLRRSDQSDLIGALEFDRLLGTVYRIRMNSHGYVFIVQLFGWLGNEHLLLLYLDQATGNVSKDVPTLNMRWRGLESGLMPKGPQVELTDVNSDGVDELRLLQPYHNGAGHLVYLHHYYEVDVSKLKRVLVFEFFSLGLNDDYLRRDLTASDPNRLTVEVRRISPEREPELLRILDIVREEYGVFYEIAAYEPEFPSWILSSCDKPNPNLLRETC